MASIRGAAGSFSRRTISRERIREGSEASCYFPFGHWASSLHVVTKPCTDKTFEELVAVRTEHCSPQPSEVMQQFRFNSRSRKVEESVAAYVVQLRHLAEFCNCGTTLGLASSPVHAKNGEAPGTHCLRMRLISPRCGDSGLFSDSSVSCDVRVRTRYSKLVRII